MRIVYDTLQDWCEYVRRQYSVDANALASELCVLPLAPRIHSGNMLPKGMKFIQIGNATQGTMPDDHRMTIDERRKYLRRMKKRYEGATKKGRERPS